MNNPLIAGFQAIQQQNNQHMLQNYANTSNAQQSVSFGSNPIAAPAPSVTSNLDKLSNKTPRFSSKPSVGPQRPDNSQ